MTDAEAKERAERIACLYAGTKMLRPALDSLASEIARELQRVAQESGWQKEELKKMQNESLATHKARLVRIEEIK